jgi:hypothetical protein
MRKEGRNGPDADKDKNELTDSPSDDEPLERLEPIRRVVPEIERLNA